MQTLKILSVVKSIAETVEGNMLQVKQLTRDEAIALYDAKFYEDMTPKERGLFQLYQKCLCMPFDLFHEGIEALLGRSVWTHEFADADLLRAEYEGRLDKPDMGEILERLNRHTKGKVVLCLAT